MIEYNNKVTLQANKKEVPFKEGDKYGYFTMTGLFIKRPNERGLFWECVCECGEKRYLPAWRVKSGLQKSCGCKAPKFKQGHRIKELPIDLIIGNFKLTGRREHRYAKKALFVEAICGCGKSGYFRYDYLVNGHTKSCGCKKSEILSKKLSKHGLSKECPIYIVWRGIRQRCMSESSEAYKDYGGRGILICQEWQDDFMNFRKWALSNGYNQGLTIDRRNNDGNYEPDNCHFTTQIRQQRNTRKTIYLTAFGEKKSLPDWAEDSRCAVGYSTLSIRVRELKWDHERALTTQNANKNASRK